MLSSRALLRLRRLVFLLLFASIALWGCDDSTGNESDPDLVDQSGEDLSPDESEDKDQVEPDDQVEPEDQVDVEDQVEPEDTADIEDTNEPEDVQDQIEPDDVTDVEDTHEEDTGNPTRSIVYGITGGDFADGELIDVLDVVVTGVNTVETVGHPIFVQVPPQSALYDGVEGSGLYVYLRKTEEVLPEVGDRINLRGKVENGQTGWLNYGRGVEILESDYPLPTPIEVSPAEVASGARAKDLAAVRLSLSDVWVEDIAPTPDAGDDPPTHEFELEGGLRVDDFLHLLDAPEVDDHYASLEGILHYSYNHYRLLPTSNEDALRHPRLESLSPSTLALQPGTTRDMSLRLNRPAPFALDVDLSYGSSALSGPTTLSFGEGDQEISFTVEGQSAAASVVLGAAYDRDTLTAEIAVVDVEPVAVVEVQPAFQKWASNSETAFTIVLAEPAPAGGQVVSIDSSGANYNLITVTDTVIIPEGEDRINVPVMTKSQTGVAELYVYTDGNSNVPTTQVHVVPSFPDELVIAEVLFNPTGTDDQREWVLLFNSSGAPIELAGTSVRFANSTAPNFNASFNIIDLPDETLPIGACLLIGGPDSDASNGDPVYDVAQDFTSDMTNATGSNSAGVAFFDVNEIQQDTLIYGGNGSNPGGIQHADGSTDVDVADSEMVSGASLKRRQDLQWEVSATLSPNVCPPF